jgi:DnaJ like chaperone protein
MTASEVFAVVIGLLLGYWVISWLMALAHSRGHNNTSHGKESDGTGHTAEGKKHGESGNLDATWIRAHWFEVLGVTPGATVGEIKSAYRMRVRQYHPDRTEGLGPELRSLALRKTQELNVAYAWALRLARPSARDGRSAR